MIRRSCVATSKRPPSLAPLLSIRDEDERDIAREAYPRTWNPFLSFDT
jgi:hypothetical protein